MLRRSLLAALAVVALTGHALAAPVVVFAAASLKNALDEVNAAYAASGGEKAAISYGASSTLAKQIENGAPAAVFVSADADWMDDVQKKNLIVPTSRRDLLSNHLALIAPVESKVTLVVRKGFPLAKSLGADGHLAMAGPDVPAGRYGDASLKALGVWADVRSRIVRGENVRAALAFVARGEAPLGIVYDTDAKVEPKVRIVGLFPDSTHPRIVYPVALVGEAKNAGAPFLHFLEGPRAAAIFRRYGFITLGR